MLPVVVGALTMGTKLARANDLKMVFFNAFPPISFENDAHAIIGVLPDMMTEIFGNRLKIPMSMQGMPWHAPRHRCRTVVLMHFVR